MQFTAAGFPHDFGYDIILVHDWLNVLSALLRNPRLPVCQFETYLVYIRSCGVALMHTCCNFELLESTLNGESSGTSVEVSP
jgi:hypothetical protein